MRDTGTYKVEWSEGGIHTRTLYDFIIPSVSLDPRAVALAIARGLKAGGFKGIRVIRTDTVIEVIPI